MVGTVGSGKSALLLSMIGDLHQTSGSVHRRWNSGEDGAYASHFNNGVGYVGQEAWLLQGDLPVLSLLSPNEFLRLTVSLDDLVQRNLPIENLPSGSVRENVLFGLPMSTDWYGTVLDACCLHEDILAMPDGDATQVGEKGEKSGTRSISSFELDPRRAGLSVLSTSCHC